MRTVAAIEGKSRHSWRSALVLATVLLTVAQARAQMLPFVPDPVTTPELMGYADMLGLSKEQRLAALDVHDAYRRDFRALEDGEVRTFVQDLLGMARNFMRAGLRVPERSEFENLIEQFNAIMTKAKTLDRNLLDRLAPILTDEQLASLPSVRIERELEVYAHLMDGPGGMNPGAPVVLSSMVRNLDLGEEEIAQTEGLLRQYEQRAIRRTRKLYRLLEEAAELALDTLDRTGVRDLTPLELMQLGEDDAFEDDMRVTFNEGSIPLQAELFAASQQNLALLRQLTPLLSKDNADALRHAYYRAAYRRVYQHRSPWRFAYVRAIALESLDGAQKEQVVAQQDRFRRQEDQLIDRIVLQVEARREYRTVEQLDGDEAEDMEKRMTAYREERDTINGSAMAALGSILTPGQWASVESGASDADVGPGEEVVRTVAGGGGGGGGTGRDVEAEIVVEDDEPDTPPLHNILGMPMAMSLDRRVQLARLAQLDEGHEAILESLFEDYRFDYAAALELMMREDAQDEGESGAKDSGAKETAKNKERFQLRLATLAALDDALFESMRLVLDGESARTALRLGRRLRARERATIAAQPSAFVFGREESYTDCVGVVLAMERCVEIIAATHSMIESYGEIVGPLVDQRLVAAREAQRQYRLASRMEEHGRPGKRMAKKVEAKAEDSRQQVRRLDRRIRDENRQLLSEAERLLGSDLGWMIRVAYQRAAYPEIYEDELGLDDAMATARLLDDLTTSQAGQVERIVNDYRSAFMELSERMVRLRGQRDFEFTTMQMPSPKVIQGEISLERLRFDRREAGARAILRLRLALSDHQVARCSLPRIPMPKRRAFD